MPEKFIMIIEDCIVGRQRATEFLAHMYDMRQAFEKKEREAKEQTAEISDDNG